MKTTKEDGYEQFKRREDAYNVPGILAELFCQNKLDAESGQRTTLVRGNFKITSQRWNV